MAVSYVGGTSPVFGNNAAVTAPAWPSGIQEGDLVIAHAAIRDIAASFSAPSGWWSLGAVYGNSTTSIFTFTFVYVNGAPLPTFTPSGGGANDTTALTLQAFRGTAGLYNGVQPSSYNVQTSTLISVAFYSDPSPSFVDGGGLHYVAFGDNDFAATSFEYLGAAPSFFGGQTSGLSALGADATIACQTQLYDTKPTVFNPLGSTIRFGATSLNLLSRMFILVPSEPAEDFYAPEPTGGAKAGGDSTFVLEAVNAATGDGGAKAGGAADTELFRYGLQLRTTPTYGSICEAGSVSVTVPAASIQVDDLLIAHVVTRSSSTTWPVPSTPTGWNVIPSTNSGGFTECSLFWRRWQSGDSFTSVSFDFPTDGTSCSKHVALSVWKNVDWAFNGGNPFNAVFNSGGNSYNMASAWLQPMAAPYNSSIQFFGSDQNQYSSATSSAIAAGWSEVYDRVNNCLYPADTHCYVAYTPGARVDFTMPAYELSSISSTGWIHWLNISVATVGPTLLDEEVTGAGGAIAAGAASVIGAGQTANHIVEGEGGVLWSSSTVAYLVEGAPIPELYGMTAFWPSAARVLRAEGTYISAAVGGLDLRLAQVRSSRTAEKSGLVLYALSSSAPCAVGSSVEVRVEYRLAGGGSVASSAWTATVSRLVELSPGRWKISLIETSLRLGGVSWAPLPLLAQSERGARLPANFELVPGDYVNGQRVAAVTTSAVAGGLWSSEVSFDGTR